MRSAENDDWDEIVQCRDADRPASSGFSDAGCCWDRVQDRAFQSRLATRTRIPDRQFFSRLLFSVNMFFTSTGRVKALRTA